MAYTKKSGNEHSHHQGSDHREKRKKNLFKGNTGGNWGNAVNDGESKKCSTGGCLGKEVHR